MFSRKAEPRKEKLYVKLSSHKAVFLVTGEAKKSKYSYGVPIIPLHGYYYVAKLKRKMSVQELKQYYVILNVNEEDADALKGRKLVVLGYNDDEVLVAEKG
jgi:hypothetical protein